jgi:hypothetical protein
LEKRAEQVLPGSKRGREEKERVGDRGRNGPNNVCTCEQMNKKMGYVMMFSYMPAVYFDHILSPAMAHLPPAGPTHTILPIYVHVLFFPLDLASAYEKEA